MVICKFFQQGSCRYGNNCRFEHSYNSKYSYHAPSANTSQQTPAAVTDEQLVNQVRADILAALKGGQWILSSYAPFKEKPVIPGISDLSPEEARLFIYEAKVNNTVDQAVSYMNNLLKETRYRYEQLLQPNPAITNTLRRLYNGESVSSPFSATSGFGPSNNASNAASSVFRSAVQNTQNTASVFGQNNTAASVFAQAPNNVFGPSPDIAKSIFAQATQSVFASPQQQTQLPFAQSPDAAKSIFAQANQNVAQQNQNVFQTQTQQQANPSSIFASASQQFFGKAPEPFQQPSASPFGQNTSPFAQQPSQPQNVFQKPEQPSNVFGTKNVFEQQIPNDTGIYSNMEDLTESDLEAFNSADFKLGFVPEIPPPQSLCV